MSRTASTRRTPRRPAPRSCPWVITLCDDCAETLPDKRRHAVTLLSAVQGMLLDRYAMDVMP